MTGMMIPDNENHNLTNYISTQYNVENVMNPSYKVTIFFYMVLQQESHLISIHLKLKQCNIVLLAQNI